MGKKGASIGSSIASLANCVIGSGVLALPFAMKCAGLALGQLFLFIVAAGSGAAFIFLMGASDTFHLYSYKSIAAQAKPWFGVLAEVFCVLYTLGTISGYGVVVSDSLADFITDIAGKSPSRWLLMLGLMAVMLPLSLLPKLDFLRFTSAAAVICVAYILFVVIYHISVVDASTLEVRGAIHLVNTASPSDIFKTFPLIGVAFTAHYACLSIYKELNSGADDAEAKVPLLDDQDGAAEPEKPERRIRAMRIVVVVSMLICVSFYAIMGGTGYALFRSTTKSNILQSFIAGNAGVEVSIARAAILCTIMFSYPIVAFSLRRSILTLLFKGDDTAYPIQAAISVALGTLVFVMGGFAPPLGSVLSLSGTFFGSVIVYVIPGVFWLLVGRARGGSWVKYALPAWIVIGLGISVFVLGTYALVNDLV